MTALRLRDGSSTALPADAGIERDRVVIDAVRPPAAHPLVWLHASILDRRVIDVDDRRVVRVGDVALERYPRRLDVVGIELGFAPVLRRLGLRRLSERCTPDLVPLTAIHVPGKPGGAIELLASRERLAALESHDLAELLARLPLPDAGHELAQLAAEDAARAVTTLHPAHAADMLAHAPPPARASIIEHVRPRALAPALRGAGRAHRRVTHHRARRPRHR